MQSRRSEGRGGGGVVVLEVAVDHFLGLAHVLVQRHQVHQRVRVIGVLHINEEEEVEHTRVV